MIDIINDNFNDLAKDYYELQEEYEQLVQKNQQLKETIDKAIEILNKGCFEYDNCPDSVINEIIELKKILGSDKE